MQCDFRLRQADNNYRWFELEAAAVKPVLLRFDPSTDPIVRLGLTGSTPGEGINEAELKQLRRFADEELKHQELFRRMEQMIGERMPPGYRMVADPNQVARAVLAEDGLVVDL